MVAVQGDVHCFTGLSSSSDVFINAVNSRVPGNITHWMQWEELQGLCSLSRSWARCKCKIGKSLKSWKQAVHICGYVQGFPLLPTEYILPSHVTLRHKMAPIHACDLLPCRQATQSLCNSAFWSFPLLPHHWYRQRNPFQCATASPQHPFSNECCFSVFWQFSV